MKKRKWLRKAMTTKDIIQQFFKENPEALKMAKSLPPNEDGMLFSKDLRDALKPFEEMTAKEAVGSMDFMKALCKHAGMDDKTFNEILEGENELF